MVNESYSGQKVCLMHLGKGGVAFLIKEKFTCIYIERNPYRLKSDNEHMYIFSVYLPADANIESYVESIYFNREFIHIDE